MSAPAPLRPASRNRDARLVLLSLVFPNLGLMLAGLELAFGRYRFGALLILLPIASQSALLLLLLRR